MDEHSDKHQPLSPTKKPHGKEHNWNDGEEGQGVAGDVAEGRDRNQNVEPSSRPQRHQRGVAIPQSDVGPNESPTPSPPSNGNVERCDIVLYDQEEPRATTAPRIGQDSDESAAMAKPDPPQAREPRKTVSRRDLRTNAGVKESDKLEHSTSSSSSELQSPDMPQKEKREIPEKHRRPAEPRKSSKASVGSASASSARLQASNVSVSKHMSHVSRSSSMATRMPNRLPSRASIKAAEGCPHSRAGPRPAGLEQVANSKTPRHPANLIRSNISRTSTAKQAMQSTTSKTEASSKKQQASADPNICEACRVSTASRKRPTLEKAPAPSNRDERISAISASRRSRASKSKISVGSRRSRTSVGRDGDKSGVSKKSGNGRRGSGHDHHKQGEYAADKDSRSASVISLAGDSRSSAKSSRRSLRPIGPEEVPLDRIPEKPKGKLLLMPDGTYVNVHEKNLWIRAMQEKYLAIDYASCSLKFGFGLMLIGFIYIIMFRQDLLLNMAILVRDYVYDRDANDLPSKNKHKLDNKTFPGKHQSTTVSPTAPSSAQLTSQVTQKYK